MKRKVLTWADVLPAAEKAFAIWMDHPERHWAKAAWKVLVRAGLAAYANEAERCQVVIRFIALAGLYHDFCQEAWGLPSHGYHLYLDWAQELSITPLRVGQLLGRDPTWDKDYSEDELVPGALKALTDRAREEVHSALLEGFGGISLLFASLWRSNDAPRGQEGWTPETDDEILNEATGDKVVAFGWVEEGCCPIT